MAKLIINHRVPFLRGSLTFHRWLPWLDRSELNFERKGLLARIWADRSCIGSGSARVLDNEIPNHNNINLSSLLVDITIPNAPDDLADFIKADSEGPKVERIIESKDETIKRFAIAYCDLGHDVFDFVIDITNRLIGWAYAKKGQFWLNERTRCTSNMRSTIIEFKSRAKINEGEWFCWCPPSNSRVTVYGYSHDRYISADDWRTAEAFISSDRNPPLVGELLANAERLLSEGHLRSAVMESYCALESAVNEFARKPNNEIADNLRIITDSAKAALGDQLEHMGFSATVRYLLPLLFDNSAVDREVWEFVGQLVEMRNAIVHSGKREVEEYQIRHCLYATRTLCDTLLRNREVATRSNKK